MMMGTCVVVEVDENATTDELIGSIAAKINVSKDRIKLCLNACLDIKGRVATQENAKDVDAKVQEQFKFNIVNFIKYHDAGPIIVKP